MLTEIELESETLIGNPETLTTINIPTTTFIADTHPLDQSRSAQINDLNNALARAQANMEVAAERKYRASRGGYPRMADIVIASRPYLAAEGIAVNQKIYTDNEGRDYLRTEMSKGSQWTSSTIRYDFPKSDLDAWQSFIDKMKREAYKAITGCVSDEDDDGIAAMDMEYKKKDKGTEPNITYTPKHESSDFITKEQAIELRDECNRYPDIVEQIYNRWKIKNIADLRKSQLKDTKDYIRTTIQRRDGLK